MEERNKVIKSDLLAAIDEAKAALDGLAYSLNGKLIALDRATYDLESLARFLTFRAEKARKSYASYTDALRDANYYAIGKMTRER